VNILTAIQFAPEIDQIGAVYFLNEDDRDALLTRFVYRDARFGHPLLVARHVVDCSYLACVNESARLNVDDNQRGPSFDQLSFTFG